MTAKEITIDFIRAYCVDNNQQAWYNEMLTKKYPQKVYPRKKVDGKSVVDKTAEPTTMMKPITFIQLKQNFITKFMPELAPKAEKKESLMFKPL